MIRGRLARFQGVMYFRQSASVLLFALALGLLLSCGTGAHPAADLPSGQVLYVLNGGSISTYSVDPTSLEATLLEQPVELVPPPASLLQFDPSPHDHFVYAVWSDGQNVQHLSVFATDSYGVPQLPAIQTLDADSLSQFNLHPNGQFAYMLQITQNNNEYYAKIRLFEVKGTNGILKENVQFQGTYGPAPFWPAQLYGFSPDGNKLYDTSPVPTGSVYRQRSINKSNGTLGADNQLITLSGNEDVVIGSVIAVQRQSDVDPGQAYLDIFPNVPKSKRTIHCTQAMLMYCSTATNIQLDRSGRFLFLTDPATAAVHVVWMNLAKNRIVDTQNSMPMTSQTPGYVFNQSGKIVYAMQTDGSIHFFHFDATSGALTEGGTPLPIAPGGGICPAHYQ